MIDFKAFWCCLNPRERNIASACLLAFFGIGSYIRKSTFDVLWLPYLIIPGSSMYNAFVSYYALTAGTVMDENGDPVDVYFLDLNYWSQMYAFSQTNDFLCSEPCKILRFTNIV